MTVRIIQGHIVHWILFSVTVLDKHNTQCMLHLIYGCFKGSWCLPQAVYFPNLDYPWKSALINMGVFVTGDIQHWWWGSEERDLTGRNCDGNIYAQHVHVVDYTAKAKTVLMYNSTFSRNKLACLAFYFHRELDYKHICFDWGDIRSRITTLRKFQEEPCWLRGGCQMSTDVNRGQLWKPCIYIHGISWTRQGAGAYLLDIYLFAGVHAVYMMLISHCHRSAV